MRVTPTLGLTMAKVTSVQLALHQICADERNPRSMTAHIMAFHEVTSDDVMAVCNLAYLAIEDMRERNLRATSPAYDLSDEDNIVPPTYESVAPVEQEMPSRELPKQPQQAPAIDDEYAAMLAAAVQDNQNAFGTSLTDSMRASIDANKAKVLGNG